MSYVERVQRDLGRIAGPTPASILPKPLALARRRLRQKIVVMGLVRPIYKLIPGVKYVSHSVSGHVGTYQGFYLFRTSVPMNVSVEVRNEARTPRESLIVVSLDGDKAKKDVRLKAGETSTIRISKTIYDPKYYDLRIRIYGKYTRILQDSVSTELPIGVLDERSKPVSEYPVQGAENLQLDLRVQWRGETYAYPEPPRDVSFGAFFLTPRNGVKRINGRLYRDVFTQANFEARFDVANYTNKVLKVRTWGVAVAVIYEDMRHISYVDVTGNASISRPDEIPVGTARRFTISVPIPIWVYGHVSIITAFLFEKDRDLYYAGGPVYEFNLYRLRLP